MTDERSVEEIVRDANVTAHGLKQSLPSISAEITNLAAALQREKARAEEMEKALDTLIAAFASHPVSSIIKAKARKSLAAALSSEQSKEGGG
jgi:HPt (histidine-containing phosphotransfer) domain-containing protein